MPTVEPRRSARLNTHDSNGRDHLADLLPGWTRSKLEGWIISPTVRPHLQLWYQLCIASERRLNDGVGWINTDDKGYFYYAGDLEEDLLLMCLCEGQSLLAEEVSSRGGGDYADEEAQTGRWITQELWARTAWRIVHANSNPEQAFHDLLIETPAACYGFVIEIMCIAFHSIAFRGKTSCYEWLINGLPSRSKKRAAELEDVKRQAELDADAESVTSVETMSSSTETSDHSSDLDWEQKVRIRCGGRKKTFVERVEDGEDTIGAEVVRNWIAGLAADYLALPPATPDNMESDGRNDYAGSDVGEGIETAADHGSCVESSDVSSQHKAAVSLE